MYKRWNKAHTADVIRRIAEMHRVPEAQVRADITDAMHAGKTATDPAAQDAWASFHYAGTEPTEEEFILWVVSRLTEGEKDK